MEKLQIIETPQPRIQKRWNKWNNWIPIFLILFYGYCLLVNGSLQIAPDEAYYWYWSKHLDWSYFDHPPMVAYVMAFFTWIGGNSEFFVRFGGWICAVLSLCFIFGTIKRLFPANKHLRWELLFLYQITLIFPAGAIVQTPDTPMILFWSMAVYCGSRIITEGGSKWWYVWGIALGLGLLSKYTMILLVPCQFGFFFLSKRHRFWMFKKYPYLALLLALLIFSPVLYWNWQHDWASFVFQLNQGLSPADEAFLLKILKYVGGQAGIITPVLFLAFIFYGVMGIYYALVERISSYLYLVCLSWPILIFFGLTSTVGEVAEPNWPAPAYVTGMILMWTIYRSRYGKNKGHRAFVSMGIGSAVLASILIHMHMNLALLPLTAENDPMKQFHSWRSLGRIIEKSISKNPHPKGYFLVSDKGTTLAEAVFYSGNQFVGLDFFIPERYLFLKNPDGELKGKNAIIISHNQSDHALKQFSKYFHQTTNIGEYNHIYRGKKIQGLSADVLLGEAYLGNWTARK